jgi:hypothetical protein
MTQTEINRSLNLVRYGGVVVTVVVFIALLAFAIIMDSSTTLRLEGATAGGGFLNALLPFILIATVITAILSVVLYFAYRAFLNGRRTA